MSISNLKALIWLVVLGLAAVSGFLLQRFAKQRPALMEAVSVPQIYDELERLPQPERIEDEVVAYATVWRTWNDFHWTGALPAQPVAEVPDEPLEAPVVPIGDLLTVLMVNVDGGDSARSVAKVRFLDAALAASVTGLDDTMLSEGEALAAPHDDVRVTAIRADGVRFRRGEEDPVLVPTIPYEQRSLIVQVGSEEVRSPERESFGYLDYRFRVPQETTLIGKNTLPRRPGGSRAAARRLRRRAGRGSTPGSASTRARASSTASS